MKLYITFLILIIAFFNAWNVSAMLPPCVEMGIFTSATHNNRLEVKIRPTIQINNGNYSGGIFVIKYPVSYNVTLNIISSPFGYSTDVQGINAGFQYRAYSFGGGSNLVNWSAGQEITVMVLEISQTGSGVGTFELTDDTYANDITFGGAFYQELSGNGQPSSDEGVQIDFYQPSTIASLPVELLHFTAEKESDGTASLKWETANEIDFSHYILEHAIDGLHYDEMAKLSATGGISTRTNYAYVHKQPYKGDNFYRLKMVNNDGSFQYSPVRVLSFGDQKEPFTLLPNPTAGPLTLMCYDLMEYDSPLRYQITDNSGRLIIENSISGEQTNFDLSAYASGVYYLNLLNDRVQIKQFKLIVMRP